MYVLGGRGIAKWERSERGLAISAVKAYLDLDELVVKGPDFVHYGA